MTLKALFFLLACLLCIFFLKKKWQFRQKEARKDAIILSLKSVYDHYNGFLLSQLAREDRDDRQAFLYGETPVLVFLDILDLFEPTRPICFYDLGSGTGHLVFAAALALPCHKAIGIELLPSLHAVSQIVKEKLQVDKKRFSSFGSQCIDFILGDFLNIDLSDADLVFLNATALFDEDWQRCQLVLNTLPAGAFVIITSKKLSGSDFILVEASTRFLSWGPNAVRVYQREISHEVL